MVGRNRFSFRVRTSSLSIWWPPKWLPIISFSLAYFFNYRAFFLILVAFASKLGPMSVCGDNPEFNSSKVGDYDGSRFGLHSWWLIWMLGWISILSGASWFWESSGSWWLTFLEKLRNCLTEMIDFFFFFIGEMCITFLMTVSSFVLAIVAEIYSVVFNTAVCSDGAWGIFLLMAIYFLS